MTTYRLAKASDAEDITRLIEESGLPFTPLGFPTIVAVADDGGLRGVVSTREDYKQAIIVEPMVAETPWVLMRLIEALENIFEASGVTQYLFRIYAVDTRYKNTIDKLNDGLTEQLNQEPMEGFFWYKRKVPRHASVH